MSVPTPVHPAVEKVRAALHEVGAHAAADGIRWLDDAVRTAALAAQALGVEPAQIANSLVFLLDGAPILVMTSGGHRVDTQFLGARLGGTLGRASKDAVRDATGQVIGGVAPVGHPAPVPTWVDEALAEHDVVWAAAGHPKTVMPLTFAELVRITDGTPTPVVEAAGPSTT